MENLERILREHRFLAGLSDDQLAFVVGCAKNVRFDEGDYLFRDGGAADAFFLVREGRVALELEVPPRGRVVAETLEGGDIIGWSWMFPPYRWDLDARAAKRVRAIQFDGACLREKMEKDSALGFVMTKKLLFAAHQRLERVRLQSLDAYRQEGGVTGMVPSPVEVRKVRRETHDTVTLTLDASAFAEGFAFAPGQFNMLYAFGAGEVPISMSGDPERRDRIVHTIRGVGGVSHSAVPPAGRRHARRSRPRTARRGRWTRRAARTSSSSREASASRPFGRRSSSCFAAARSSTASRSSMVRARRRTCCSRRTSSGGGRGSTPTSR